MPACCALPDITAQMVTAPSLARVASIAQKEQDLFGSLAQGEPTILTQCYLTRLSVCLVQQESTAVPLILHLQMVCVPRAITVQKALTPLRQIWGTLAQLGRVLKVITVLPAQEYLYLVHQVLIATRPILLQ